MASVSGAALVKAPINLSGALFNKTRVDTPLFNSIRNTRNDARLFIVGSTYDTGYPSSVSGVSETASLTAPTPEHWERTNAYNVTQIFHKSVQVSYRKQSNGSDLNNYGVGTAQPALAGNTNNVPNELAFQITNQLDTIRMEIEHCILNGSFQDSAGAPGTADQTRGLIEAITTNTIAAGTKELSYDIIYAMAEKILNSGSPYAIDQYLTVLSFEQFKQLQKVVANEGLKISETEAGVNVTSVITPFGIMKFMPHRFCPNGTAVCICLPVLSNVMQPVPGKGNFFYEELAKTGASEHGQIYGQWGLDYGPEFLHVKVTGLKTTTDAFTAPKVFVENAASFPAAG